MHRIVEFPKLLCLALSFVLAYLLYHIGAFDVLEESLNGSGYVSMLLAGMLFSFGFTSAFAVGMFIAIADHINPFLGALIGGTGAMLVDLAIFTFVRVSFTEELHRLRTSAIMVRLWGWLHHERIPERVREYILWSIGGILIASPLPDEIGITLLSSITEIDARRFSALCWALNTAGIFLILLGARSLS